MKSVRAAGGKVVKVCVMVNRDPKNINFVTIGAPFSSLGVFPAKAYEVQDCPACKNNIPFNTTVGHAKKYLELRKKK